ncbi:hypothetical protein A4H97_33565 [Niastella yeongjuensis]|uniref:Anti-sigma-28 factor FlgM C-terminal domain-containing protein n=1 Tax=Niastella yeongjuensis TaxID=354355 RepID=A0A1V9EDQ9_9BACT|nr:hypothetical protein [Niastella yeongjuensis]OQP44181.1 hypothetical protein A4H97_33565 [Niastella yeongjuensis]SEP22276.1 hypothetical protein SAMN05660816_04844 [Niastella yeongjuensis]
MSNKKTTSSNIASLASKVLLNNQSSETAKKLAGSALSQVTSRNVTGKGMETLASKVLDSGKYNPDTKKLAASILSQSDKNR